MSDFFSIAFSSESLKEIQMFYSFPVLLSEEMQQAETGIGELLIQKIHDNGMSRFMTNSPGGLAESFFLISDSPFEKEVGTDKPYGARLNWGFHGADSLGRVYDQDGTLYLTDAVTEIETSGEAMGLLQQAAETAWGRIGG